MTETFDHIIVGGGSSGCVAAARLASEGGAKVLLLEAGYSNRTRYLSRAMHLQNEQRFEIQRYPIRASGHWRTRARHPEGHRLGR